MEDQTFKIFYFVVEQIKGKINWAFIAFFHYFAPFYSIKYQFKKLFNRPLKFNDRDYPALNLTAGLAVKSAVKF